MTKIALFAGGDLTYFEYDFDYFVGIDRGSLFLLKKWAFFGHGSG